MRLMIIKHDFKNRYYLTSSIFYFFSLLAKPFLWNYQIGYEKYSERDNFPELKCFQTFCYQTIIQKK